MDTEAFVDELIELAGSIDRSGAVKKIKSPEDSGTIRDYILDVKRAMEKL